MPRINYASDIVKLAKQEVEKRSPGLISSKNVLEINAVLDEYCPHFTDPDDLVAMIVCMAIDIATARRKE